MVEQAATADLVERAQGGDQAAFAVLARHASDRLYAIAFRILRDVDRAEDALQQALIDAWDDLPGLRDPGRFDAWSYRLVVRASYRVASTERRWGSVRSVHVDEWAGSDIAGEIATHDQVERAFQRLTPEHRAVLVLRFYAGLTPNEIADVLGVAVGTVGSRLHYATAAMRAAIEADGRVGALEEVGV